MTTFLRWIALLPAAIAGSILAALTGYGLAWLWTSVPPTHLDLILLAIVPWAASGFGFVTAGTWTAPKYYAAIPITLTAAGVLIGIANIVGVYTNYHPNKIYLTARAVGFIVATVITGASIFKKGGI